MAGDIRDVRIWTIADLYVAPLGTTPPTDVATPLPSAWKALGLFHEDGGEFARDQTVTDLYAHGGVLVRTIRSKHKRSFAITPLENAHEVWSLANPGSSAITTPAQGSTPAFTTRTVRTPKTGDIRAFVAVLVDGDITTRRVIERGELVEVGAETITDENYPASRWTINIYPKANGALFTEITDDPAAIVPGS